MQCMRSQHLLAGIHTFVASDGIYLRFSPVTLNTSSLEDQMHSRSSTLTANLCARKNYVYESKVGETFLMRTDASLENSMHDRRCGKIFARKYYGYFFLYMG